MKVRLIGERRTVLVRLCGELDHHNAAKIKEEVDRMIRSTNAVNIIFDFTELSFMDSSGIAVVINALRCMSRIDGKLVLSGLADQPLKVFRTSGIDKLVELKEVVL